MTEVRIREWKAKLDKLKAERAKSAERVQKLQADNQRVLRRADEAKRILQQA